MIDIAFEVYMINWESRKRVLLLLAVPLRGGGKGCFIREKKTAIKIEDP